MSANVPLGICAQLSFRKAVSAGSLLGTFWVGKVAVFLHVDNEDFDWTVHVQADLSLYWEHLSEGTFSDVLTRMLWVLIRNTSVRHF